MSTRRLATRVSCIPPEPRTRAPELPVTPSWPLPLAPPRRPAGMDAAPEQLRRLRAAAHRHHPQLLLAALPGRAAAAHDRRVRRRGLCGAALFRQRPVAAPGLARARRHAAETGGGTGSRAVQGPGLGLQPRQTRTARRLRLPPCLARTTRPLHDPTSTPASAPSQPKVPPALRPQADAQQFGAFCEVSLAGALAVQLLTPARSIMGLVGYVQASAAGGRADPCCRRNMVSNLGGLRLCEMKLCGHANSGLVYGLVSVRCCSVWPGHSPPYTPCHRPCQGAPYIGSAP
jgi:hypothetical protein